MALGATRGEVAWLAARRGLRLAIVGVIAGLGGRFAARLASIRPSRFETTSAFWSILWCGSTVPSLAIVPAAGRAERFGRQKLVEDVGGEPLINRTIRCLLDGGVDAVIVVAPPGERFESVPFVHDARVRVVDNPDPSRGMFSSIQAGLAAASGGDPILLLPGDMPFVAPATVAAVLARPIGPGRVVVPRFDGARGHPLALPRSLGSEILKADARSNLSELLTALGVARECVDVADPGVVRDVDVRGDLNR